MNFTPAGIVEPPELPPDPQRDRRIQARRRELETQAKAILERGVYMTNAGERDFIEGNEAIIRELRPFFTEMEQRYRSAFEPRLALAPVRTVASPKPAARPKAIQPAKSEAEVLVEARQPKPDETLEAYLDRVRDLPSERQYAFGVRPGR
jgi:hypothetical protein